MHLTALEPPFGNPRSTTAMYHFHCLMSQLEEPTNLFKLYQMFVEAEYRAGKALLPGVFHLNTKLLC